MSGYDATRVLKSKAETSKIPIVALTAHAMSDERDRALAAGCDGYIVKPISVKGLLETLANSFNPRQTDK